MPCSTGSCPAIAGAQVHGAGQQRLGEEVAGRQLVPIGHDRGAIEVRVAVGLDVVIPHAGRHGVALEPQLQAVDVAVDLAENGFAVIVLVDVLHSHERLEVALGADRTALQIGHVGVVHVLEVPGLGIHADGLQCPGLAAARPPEALGL